MGRRVEEEEEEAATDAPISRRARSPDRARRRLFRLPRLLSPHRRPLVRRAILVVLVGQYLTMHAYCFDAPALKA